MTHEFVHFFKGFHMWPSTCLVKILTDNDKTFVCFIDLGDGTSVTNVSEQLATEIVNEYKLDPQKCRFFETYQQYEYETFDEVKYTWKDRTAYAAQWKPALEEIKKIFIN